MSNTGQAWVTLATNDSYALGALVLAQSLKRNNTIHQLAVLITPGVSPAMREALSSTFDLVKEVDVLDSKDAANLALLARPDLGITFTKLHCWNLIQYTKCVFLDADTLVVKNCDELFERDELSAAPDAGWPDCFNSGVFVFIPSETTFKALLDFALSSGSFDGGDQGLLNMYFGDWATKDITKHLPFIYNMVASATYSYLPAFKAFGGNVKIAHFIGSSKPWLQALPSGTTLSSFLDIWWDIFLKDVSKNLNTNMIINCTVFEEGPQASKFSTPHPPPTTVQRHVFVDPWDYIQQNHPKKTDSYSYLNTEEVVDRLVEHLKQTQQHHHLESHSSPEHHNHQNSIPHYQPTYAKQYSAPDLSHNKEFVKEASQTYSNILNEQKKTQSLQHLQQRPLQNHYGLLYTQKEDIREEPLRRVESYENIPSTISPPFTPSCVEQTSFLTNTGEPTAVTEEEGLAGALAGGQKDIIEDQWRKQSWEQGNIDYMGKDAFENIWKKISETVGEEIKPLEAPVLEVIIAQEESAPAPTLEVLKTETKTDSSEVDSEIEALQPQSESPKAEATPETTAVAESVVPPKPEATAVAEPVVPPKPEATAVAESVVPPKPEATAVAESVVPPKPEATAVAESVVPPKPEATAVAESVVPPKPETTAVAEPVVPPKPETPQATEAKKEEASKLEASGPSAPQAEAAAVPQVPDVEPKDKPQISAVPVGAPLEAKASPVEVTEPSEPAEVIPSVQQPSAPAEPAPAATTETAAEEPAPTPEPTTQPEPAVQPPCPPSPTAEVPSSPKPPQPVPKKVPKTSTPPPADKKGPSLPKDDSKPPETPKEEGAEKVVEAVQDPAAPTPPSVPSPASPSAPEGTKVDAAQSPISPEPQTPSPAETSSPPQTPTGDAPVPPKRSSKKGKAKK